MIQSIIILSTIALGISYAYFNNINKIKTEKPKKYEPINIVKEDQYLQHMIPHHQAAIDICTDYLKKTTDPNMTYLCRHIMWQQGYEIFIMKNIMNKLEFSFDPIIAKTAYMKTVFQFYEPQVDNPDVGNIPLSVFTSRPIMTDEQFMINMIAHHQMAVNMSKSMLDHTSNNIIIDLCYDIIKEETKEISQMQHTMCSKTVFKYDSSLLK
jgi:hypothetical protein